MKELRNEELLEINGGNIFNDIGRALNRLWNEIDGEYDPMVDEDDDGLIGDGNGDDYDDGYQNFSGETWYV